MLNEVTAYGFPAVPLSLPLNSEESPIQIKDIQGLGPVKANINRTQMSQYELITGSTLSARNIVITVGFNPDWVTQTYESLRNLLYEYFMPQSTVELRFKSTHMPEVKIQGVVEDCAPSIFSSDPEVVISIICPKSNFLGLEPKGTFGFTDDLGPGKPPSTMEYLGTAPAGVLLTLQSNPTVPSYDGPIQAYIEGVTFYYSARMDSARVTEWSTVPGDKFVRVRTLSTGLKRSLLSTVPNGMVWPVLRKGTNHIRLNANVAGMTWVLSYTEQFGGI